MHFFLIWISSGDRNERCKGWENRNIMNYGDNTMLVDEFRESDLVQTVITDETLIQSY